MRRTLEIWKLVGAILLCEGAGAIGAVATARSRDGWYRTLAKPAWTPPDWVFGPIWTLLYGLMGVALYLATTGDRQDERILRLGERMFALQLGLNTSWSILFFGRRSILGALVTLPFLWDAIALTTLAFWRLSKPAGLLMLPYLAWTSFAFLLNARIWQLNQDR